MGDNQHRAGFNRHLLHPWAELGNLGHDKATTVISHGQGPMYMIQRVINYWMALVVCGVCKRVTGGRRSPKQFLSRLWNWAIQRPLVIPISKEVELAVRIAAETPGDLDRIYSPLVGPPQSTQRSDFVSWLAILRASPSQAYTDPSQSLSW